MYKKFREFHEDAKFADMTLYNGMGGRYVKCFFKKNEKKLRRAKMSKISEKSANFFQKKLAKSNKNY